MKFALFSLLASPLLVESSNLIKVTQPQKVEYQTDLYQGTELKQQQATLNNSELTYTDRNGRKCMSKA
jgi:catalase